MACELFDELREKLNPELLRLHQKLIDLLSNNRSDEADFYFAEGFKLGLLVGIECME